MATHSQFFRAGVVIVVIDANGNLLALRRADIQDAAWQLPQGGVELDESPAEAMWRELEEEVGLTKEHCELLAVSKDWHAYELPEEYRSSKLGRGQVQRWFVCRLLRSDTLITPDGQEFDDWKWTTTEALLSEIVPFRQRAYASAFAEFVEFLR